MRALINCEGERKKKWPTPYYHKIKASALTLSLYFKEESEKNVNTKSQCLTSGKEW